MSKWKVEKPKKWKECILITATLFNDRWEYTLFTVEKVNGEEGWYWGLICDDGEEWGDIDDLKADLYLVMRPLKTETDYSIYQQQKGKQ